ncbi:hypothetical protein [Parachlamydia sp. AcF125]|nr:hypothetical protein [Parachlamydia sp. AcF125]
MNGFVDETLLNSRAALTIASNDYVSLRMDDYPASRILAKIQPTDGQP